jgi:hypothetical protein
LGPGRAPRADSPHPRLDQHDGGEHLPLHVETALGLLEVLEQRVGRLGPSDPEVRELGDRREVLEQSVARSNVGSGLDEEGTLETVEHPGGQLRLRGEEPVDPLLVEREQDHVARRRPDGGVAAERPLGDRPTVRLERSREGAC